MMEKAEELMYGGIDLHVHSSPCLFDRPLDHFELAEEARSKNMQGVMLKTHYDPSVFKAELVKQKVRGIEVYGGVVLNSFVGGLNPAAVEVAIQAGGKMVWMPTITAANHIEFYGETQYKSLKRRKALDVASQGITILDEEGNLKPEVFKILDLIAESSVILGTGHLSANEIDVLIEEALRNGIEKILVTHPFFEVPNLSLQDQIKYANKGIYLEKSFCSVTPMWATVSIDRMVESIKKIGPDKCVLVSDLGQMHNPRPADGMQQFIQMLLEKGIGETDIRTMFVENPAQLIGARK